MVSPRTPIGKRYRPSGEGNYGDVVIRKRGGRREVYGEDYEYLGEQRLLVYSSEEEDDDEVLSYLHSNFRNSSTHSLLDGQRTERELVASALRALQHADETNSPDVQMDEEEWAAWQRHLEREEMKLKSKQAALQAARTRTAAAASAPILSSSPKYPLKDRETNSSSYLPYPGGRSAAGSTSSLRHYVDTPPLTPPSLATASNSSRKKSSKTTAPYPEKHYYPQASGYAGSTASSSSRHRDRSERERDEKRGERKVRSKYGRRGDDSD